MTDDDATSYLAEAAEHARRIRAAIGHLADAWPHMLPTGPAPIRYGVGKQAQITAHDHAQTSADIDASTRLVSLRREAQDTLAGWVVYVAATRPVRKAVPNGQDVPGMCAFLRRHAEWISWQDTAPRAARRLEGIARRAHAHVHPPRKDYLVLGDCPFVHDGMFCRGRVQWYDEPGRLPACTECDQAAVVEWWEAVLGVVPTVTWAGLQDFIRRQFGRTVSRSTLRQWKRRGIIDACGVDAEGRTLYDKGAVAYALARRGAA